MTPEQLAALKQEIANTESSILNMEAHAKSLQQEANAAKLILADMKAKLPKP